MRPLRYSINITLDGCVDHTACDPNEELHHYSAQIIAQADALIFGRVMYELMADAFREPAETEIWPDWMDEWMRALRAHHKRSQEVRRVEYPRTRRLECRA